MSSMLDTVLVAVGCLLLLAAAVHDVIARTIPNAITAAVAVSGLALRLHDGSAAAGLTAALAAFLCCSLAWRAGWMGGGDVKLFAAAALLVRPESVPGTIVAISAAGIVLALPYLLSRKRLPRSRPGGRRSPLPLRAWRAELFRLRRGGPVPYGAAIAAGAILILLVPRG